MQDCQYALFLIKVNCKNNKMPELIQKSIFNIFLYKIKAWLSTLLCCEALY